MTLCTVDRGVVVFDNVTVSNGVSAVDVQAAVAVVRTPGMTLRRRVCAPECEGLGCDADECSVRCPEVHGSVRETVSDRLGMQREQ